MQNKAVEVNLLLRKIEIIGFRRNLSNISDKLIKNYTRGISKVIATIIFPSKIVGINKNNTLKFSLKNS